MITTKSLCFDFPLRQDYLAQIVIPIDMTFIEAKRLCAFIESLTMPNDAALDRLGGWE